LLLLLLLLLWASRKRWGGSRSARRRQVEDTAVSTAPMAHKKCRGVRRVSRRAAVRGVARKPLPSARSGLAGRMLSIPTAKIEARSSLESLPRLATDYLLAAMAESPLPSPGAISQSFSSPIGRPIRPEPRPRPIRRNTCVF
jgi:hypothetical protein